MTVHFPRLVQTLQLKGRNGTIETTFGCHWKSLFSGYNINVSTFKIKSSKQVFKRAANVALPTCYSVLSMFRRSIAGADPGFQVRGGAHLKKNCAERREARKFLGYYV